MFRGLATLSVFCLIPFSRSALGRKCVAAMEPGYPVNPNLLAGPQALREEAKSCPLQVLLLPKEPGKP
jgi:hypothetical protein